MPGLIKLCINLINNFFNKFKLSFFKKKDKVLKDFFINFGNYKDK